jgi:hypothetical protein
MFDVSGKAGEIVSEIANGRGFHCDTTLSHALRLSITRGAGNRACALKKSMPAGKIACFTIRTRHGAIVPGVYIISTLNDAEIVYARMTRSQTVSNRFSQHCHDRGTSDLRTILPVHQNYPQKYRDYRVRWLRIDDYQERRFFESFVVGVLQPPFNETRVY